MGGRLVAGGRAGRVSVVPNEPVMAVGPVACRRTVGGEEGIAGVGAAARAGGKTEEGRLAGNSAAAEGAGVGKSLCPSTGVNERSNP